MLARALGFLLGVTAIAAQAADPGLMSLMMPDAQILAGANVGQIRSSPFGQYLLARFSSTDAGFQALLNATGFDPRRDVQEVLVSASGISQSSLGSGSEFMSVSSGLFAIRGSFNPVQIMAAAATQGVAAFGYQGVPILSKPKSDSAVAFLDASLALAGDTESVKAALDRRAHPVALNPQLVAKAQALSASQDVWMVSVAQFTSPPGLAPLEDFTAAARKIQQVSCGIRFAASADLSAEAVLPSNQDAKVLADVLKMLAGMSALGLRGGEGSAVPGLLQSLKVISESNITRASLSIPESQLELLLFPAPVTRAQRAQSGIRTPVHLLR